MRLFLRNFFIPARDVSRMLLCDERGEPLPGQQEVTLVQTPKGLPTITVTFAVDDRSVIIGPDPVPDCDGGRRP